MQKLNGNTVNFNQP